MLESVARGIDLLSTGDHRIENFDHLPKTRELMKQALDARVSSAIWAGYWDHRQMDRFFALPMGATSYEATAHPIQVDTLFDIASVTKVLVASTLAARFVERKWLHWDQEIAFFLPEFKHSGITIAHLLSHTAGFEAWVPLWQKVSQRLNTLSVWNFPIEERNKLFLEELRKQKPITKPGEACVYSDLSVMLLEPIFEQLGEASLESLVEEHVFDFLELETAHYRHVLNDPMKAQDVDVVATEKSEAWGGALLQGQVHDENCFAKGGVGVHAGVFCSGLDLLQFGDSLLSGMFESSTIDLFSKRVASPVGCSRTVGWDTPTPPESSAGSLFSAHSIGHLGYTGTSLWIDLKDKLAVVLLTNRVHPTRANDKIKQFRKDFHNTLREELARVSST